MEPLRVHVPQETLDELRGRLARTRWPREARAEDRELAERWLNAFDWRRYEERANAFHHFQAEVDGVRLHFLYERCGRPDAIPLVLTHGWPSSFLEYLPLVPLLTEAGFDVVVPSLPGFAFSESLPPGNSRRIPALWAHVMTDVLGYERFGAYGGDIGGMVTNRLALEFPERLLGIVVSFLAEPELAEPLSERERALVEGRPRGEEDAGAYAHLLRTRPHAVAVALNDSPAGLLAWLADKWREWTDELPADDLLATATLYWATGTIASSAQIYADWKLGSAGKPVAWERVETVPPGVDSRPLEAGQRISVPAGVALFSLARWPREWAERAYADIRRWSELPRGGHFGALEEPELLAEELISFFSLLAR